MTDRIIKINTKHDRIAALKEAICCLKRGDLIAFPTDTVYGLAALDSHEEACGNLFKAKKRPKDKAIPLFVSGVDQIEIAGYDITHQTKKLIKSFWPGALTIILKNKKSMTKAFRMPDHPFVLDLLNQLKEPLAVTSANISGNSSCRSARDVAKELGNVVGLIVDDGDALSQGESTICDLTKRDPAILRKGPVSIEQISAAIKEN